MRQARKMKSAVHVLALAVLLPLGAQADVRIRHTALEEVATGIRAGLEARVSGSSGQTLEFRDVRAYFKTQPADRFFYVPMRPASGDRFDGVLPAMGVGAESFDYFILARTRDDTIARTRTYTVRVEDDDAALARLERKPPRDIKIDVEPLEDARDMVDEARQVSDAERTGEARQAGEPDPNQRVEVRTDTPQTPIEIAGIDDYLNLRFVPHAEVIGDTAIAQAPTVATSGAFSPALIGAVAVGGAVALGGGGGSGGSSGGSSGSGSAASCNTQQVAGGDAPETRTIELGRNSGSFVFRFQTFTQQDRMAVIYQGSVLFDTGCVGASGSRTLSYSGSSSQVRVAVQPNCAGGSGTAWNFTVECP